MGKSIDFILRYSIRGLTSIIYTSIFFKSVSSMLKRSFFENFKNNFTDMTLKKQDYQRQCKKYTYLVLVLEILCKRAKLSFEVLNAFSYISKFSVEILRK